MPQRVFLRTETHRLDLGDGDWVDLKKRWTVGDMKAINEAMLTVNWHLEGDLPKKQGRNGFRPGHEPEAVVQPKLEMNQSINTFSAQVEGLRRGIVAWGGPGFCKRAQEHFQSGRTPEADHADGFNGCEPTEITEEAIMALDDPTSAVITKMLDALNEGDEGGSNADGNPPQSH